MDIFVDVWDVKEKLEEGTVPPPKELTYLGATKKSPQRVKALDR